jgi:hypothetical protein
MPSPVLSLLWRGLVALRCHDDSRARVGQNRGIGAMEIILMIPQPTTLPQIVGPSSEALFPEASPLLPLDAEMNLALVSAV